MGIAVNQELRKLIQDPEIIAVAPEDIEVIDLRGLSDSSEFSLINEDSEIVIPELVIEEEDTTDIAVTVTTTVPPSTTKTQITTTTTELSQPTTELRQITFTIQDDVEEEDDTVPETIDLTEQLVEVETLQTTSSTPVVPASINADPLFQEIVNGADAILWIQRNPSVVLCRMIPGTKLYMLINTETISVTGITSDEDIKIFIVSVFIHSFIYLFIDTRISTTLHTFLPLLSSLRHLVTHSQLFLLNNFKECKTFYRMVL